LAAFCLITVISGFGVLSCGGTGVNTNTNANTQITGSLTPTQTPDPCAGVSDEMISQLIYGQLALAGFGNQLRQINITSKAHIVTLYGWAIPTAVRDKIIDIASKTPCVTSVEKSNFYDTEDNPTRRAPNGCGDGFKPCGDICIPNEEHCAWDIAKATNTASASKTDSNTTSKMNSNSNSNSKASTNSNSNSNTKKY
jgi:hypothetical protein